MDTGDESVKKWLKESHVSMLKNLPIACPACRVSIRSWLERNIFHIYSVKVLSKEHFHWDAETLGKIKKQIREDIVLDLAMELNKQGFIEHRIDKTDFGFEFQAKLAIKRM